MPTANGHWNANLIILANKVPLLLQDGYFSKMLLHANSVLK